MAAESALEEGGFIVWRTVAAPFDDYSGLRLRATVAWTASALHPTYQRNGFKGLELPAAQQWALARLVDEYCLRATA